MNLKQIIITVSFALSVANLSAQQAKLYFDFEPSSKTVAEKTTLTKDAGSIYDIMQPKYSDGINGFALDLSSDAMLRKPLTIESKDVPYYGGNSSFAFQIWIRTKPNARMGTAIAGNMLSDKKGKKGWLISTQKNGAWSLEINDGKSSFEYIPTAKQKINDGRWHQIVFSMDAVNQDMWMYLDGKNVAIYNISGFKSTENSALTFIGGSNRKSDFDGQWDAFNGYIDEAKIWDRHISSKEVAELYGKYRKLNTKAIKIANPQLKILSWNIWHGGHEFGEHVGFERVIDIIKSSQADIVGLIETYGSGEEIADSLGYYFYLISSNLSIMSRYPITETIHAFHPFNFGGAKIALSENRELVFLDTWLHYLPDYTTNVGLGKMTAKDLIKDEGKTRHSEVKKILKEITSYTDNTDAVPVVMVGDFNGGSHLDWTERSKAIHNGYVVEWPVSKEMINKGFKDSFHELNIDPLKDPGFTWSPLASAASNKYGVRDRIDFIYYKGNKLKPIESKVIDYHPVIFPSDHAAVVTVFQLK